MKKRRNQWQALGLIILFGLTAAGCGRKQEAKWGEEQQIEVGKEEVQQSEFMFENGIAFIEEGEEINIDMEKSPFSVKEKYDTLKNVLMDVDINKVALGSTTTVNMLSEIGFFPSAAPESKSLKPEIFERLYQIGEEKEGGILNIGSALSPNIELLASEKTELLLLSDALPPTKWEASLGELGVKVHRINQSEYSDMFVILQVFKDINQLDNKKINEKMRSMKQDLQMIDEVKRRQHATKDIAIITLSETAFVGGEETVLGKIAKQLSLTNVFGEMKSSELNAEELLMKNPEYLIIAGEGVKPEELSKMFEERFLTEESSLASLQAIKDGKYIFLGDDSFQFMGSIDFNVTKVMRQIAEGVYEETE